ncbi:ABC transporter ATP-binding protein [Mobilitalea sibirica]|uniref:ABC transporter ATP-binding protein n=1 Tax=Mobilitalea sibirica TaxID=1462919 RepID=A0A8J7H2E4_9FIRM|nr:ABC transporter ATP-binding protein [Mobilitalea sibirica]MBH1940918.1 ABC transporter ATP-binding protein [Mobilitalea sibirica]
MKKKKNDKSNNIAISNVIRVMKAMFERYKTAKWQVLIYMICKVSGPFLATLIPTIAIAYITEGDIGKFLPAMVGVILLASGANACTSIMGSRISNKRTYTRLGHFFYRYVKKNLTTDYSNVEPQERQRAIEKGAHAINSNWIGAERLMNETVEFVILTIGLTSYGTAILFLDIRILFIMIVMFVLDFMFRNHALKYSDKHREENTEIYRNKRYLSQSCLDLKAGKDVRVYQMEGWFHEVYNKLVKAAGIYQRKTGFRWYWPTISDQFCEVARNLLAYYILVTKAVSGEISPATFTLYLGLITGFSEWMYGYSLSLNVMRKSSHEFNEYLAVMDTKDVFMHQGGEEAPSIDQPLKIEFRDVSFRYAGSDKDILSHINLIINPGEKIALVGNNGAGKTTLVKLLCGLYQPTDGTILVNDKDISKINLTEYQSLISVLFQDINPLAFTIEMNVAGCKTEGVNRERLIESLKKAGLWEKIEKLENKEQTFITQTLHDNGIQLSGGETQRLLLARAIYKDGPILILDEPTAALDPIAESKMYQEYNELTKDKTSLFISHRLSSTKFCDRIILLENGSVAEEGAHVQLMQKQGKYKEIFDIQSHYYQEKAVG